MLLAIDSVLGTSLTLRRLHKDLNVGQPPAPAAGLTNVTFTINTLDPQTEEASFDIKRRFGIDENIVDRTSSLDLRPARPPHGDRALGASWHAIPRRRAATRGTLRASSSRSRSSSTRSSTAFKCVGGPMVTRKNRRRCFRASFALATEWQPISHLHEHRRRRPDQLRLTGRDGRARSPGRRPLSLFPDVVVRRAGF